MAPSPLACLHLTGITANWFDVAERHNLLHSQTHAMVPEQVCHLQVSDSPMQLRPTDRGSLCPVVIITYCRTSLPGLSLTASTGPPITSHVVLGLAQGGRRQ